MVPKDKKQGLVEDGLDRISEASHFLGISRSSLYELMENGELPFCKIGRSRRVPHRALVEFAARHVCDKVQNTFTT